MTPDLLDAATARAAQITKEVAQLRNEELAAITWAIQTKTPVGKTYWQDRHAAELKLWCALALVEALKE